MKMLAYYVGCNKDFRTWLAAGMPENVVSLEAYRKKKKTARKRPKVKPTSPSIA